MQSCQPVCFLEGRRILLVLALMNTEKSCLSMQSTGPGRAQPGAFAIADTFSLLSFRVTTTWSAVLHRSRWTCDESHGYGFPRPAQFPTRKPGLPTPTFLLQHTTSPLWAGGEILHVRTLALWPDCVRRCNCKMTEMEGSYPSEHLLVLQVLSPSLPCTFPH